MLAGSALAAAGAGDYARAVALLREAVRIAPGEKSLWNNLGNAIGYESSGSDPADAAYQAALRLDPADIGIRRNYARALRDAGRLADARIQFRHCLDRDPADGEARRGLAGVLDELVLREEADATLAAGAGDAATAQVRVSRANYDDSLSPEALFALHADWARAHVPTVARPPEPPGDIAGAALRVGLLRRISATTRSPCSCARCSPAPIRRG